MDACVVCRGCEVACPSGVQFGHLMEGARVALVARRSASRRAVEWLAYRLVLPRHGLLLALTWLLVVGQRLRLVPRRFRVPRLTARSVRTPLLADSAPDTFLFTGCVMDAWQRDVHRAALEVMRAAGARPGLARAGGDCCGALHSHAGRADLARSLACRVMSSMPEDVPIVVDSAGCGAAMKDYGRLVGTPEAVAFSARVRDFAEWLTAQPRLRLRDTGASVVVQDPCHLRHVQKAHDAVRAVLAPAYRLLDTADDGLCCGAGGAYAALEPGLSSEIRLRKVDAIRRAAGTVDPLVVSANPGCAMHLGAVGLDVQHPAQLLAAALSEEAHA
jgi:glycolate oxidase iron-sulfur subunit